MNKQNRGALEAMLGLSDKGGEGVKEEAGEEDEGEEEREQRKEEPAQAKSGAQQQHGEWGVRGRGRAVFEERESSWCISEGK